MSSLHQTRSTGTDVLRAAQRRLVSKSCHISHFLTSVVEGWVAEWDDRGHLRPNLGIHLTGVRYAI